VVEGDDRGGRRAMRQSPDDVTGEMAGGEGEERVDAPREHPRQAFRARGSNNTKHNNQTVHRILRRTIVTVVDDGQ